MWSRGGILSLTPDSRTRRVSNADSQFILSLQSSVCSFFGPVDLCPSGRVSPMRVRIHVTTQRHPLHPCTVNLRDVHVGSARGGYPRRLPGGICDRDLRDSVDFDGSMWFVFPSYANLCVSIEYLINIIVLKVSK
jgi:hypothetical protein